MMGLHKNTHFMKMRFSTTCCYILSSKVQLIDCAYTYTQCLFTVHILLLPAHMHTVYIYTQTVFVGMRELPVSLCCFLQYVRMCKQL